MNRRRFLTITAGCAALMAGPVRAGSDDLAVWRGTALGAAATIAFAHPEAARLTALALAEIERLEDVFSLYRADSALMRLNRDGILVAPPFDLLSALTLSDSVHRGSGGAFDPTVQPVWAAQAEAWARGRAPEHGALARAAALTGWGAVRVDAAEVRFDRAGMALTLNGIAQGLIADRVAAVLRAAGLTDVLVDAGEIAARGAPPGAAGWPVTLAAGGARLTLRDRALATSAPLGTVFDPAGRVGHIIDPATGAPAVPLWRSVSISAATAGLADALSTAACLMPDRTRLEALVARFDGAAIERAVPA